jgi:hypothetical protein
MQKIYKLFFLLTFIFITELNFAQSISKLKFINEYEVPFNVNFKNTTVGGLSGIDYDQAHDIYYLICDDRSNINPVRYYTAKIRLTEKGIDTVSFSDVVFLLQANGEKFPSSKTNVAETVDPEDIRFNSKTNHVYWTSEGERIVKENENRTETALHNPSIQIAKADGTFVGTFPLPKNLTMQPTAKGPRRNGTLESLAFIDDFQTLYTALEEPLYEDGPQADTIKTNSWIRIYQFDVAKKKNTAQYAYLLDPVAHAPVPANAFKVNGISEIVALKNKQLLTIERSYSVGNEHNTIKVFLTDLSQAEDISNTSSLIEKQPTRPAKKKLLLNMDDLGIYIDNIEGATFGPTLPNGHQTLIFVSDNNFQKIEKMQFLLFEIIP